MSTSNNTILQNYNEQSETLLEGARMPIPMNRLIQNSGQTRDQALP